MSWNNEITVGMKLLCRQPLREAVSWNNTKHFHNVRIIRQPLREAVSWNIVTKTKLNKKVVSLFVRLWVEILNILTELGLAVPSASSWGCELKYSEDYGQEYEELSASSWGCELKYPWSKDDDQHGSGQPLREAVSWNTIRRVQFFLPSSQPLREAVSWNAKT